MNTINGSTNISKNYINDSDNYILPERHNLVKLSRICLVLVAVFFVIETLFLR